MNTNTTTRILRTALVLGSAMLAACGGGGSGYKSVTAPPGDGRTVAATSGLAFTPSSLPVNVGDAVKFSFGTVGHNVFFDPQAGAPADIGGTNANLTVSRTFATAGTYRYTCHIHPTMHGEVVVR
jgi:plastocyanin